MKLTKKLEAEILKVYHNYWDSYLKGDMKTFASYLDDAITVYGSAASEIFNNKKEAVKFYTATADQMTGKAEFRKRRIRLKAAGDTIVINDLCDLYVLAGKTWMFYGHCRISAVVEQKNNSWKVIHQHASFPDSRTEEGEQIATEKIKKENFQLREAVKRRTVELEEKNKELEIEAALERVRTVAMAMKKANDMLTICKTIAQQLAKLGVNEIRNIQTAIIKKEKGTYINYEYYAKHNKTFITDVIYTNHPMSNAFIKKMLDGPNEFFKRSLTQQKTREWYAFQKTTNQFADTFLLKASSLNYYWYSLGPVALGISTYEPLSKEEQDLFVRFRNVFELSYRRFLDIEQATAQAREAQIEASLERIRAASLSMQDSSALSDIIYKLYSELTKLDAKLDRCFIMIVNPDNKGITWWMAGHEGLLAENGFFVQMNQHPSHLMYLDYCKKRKKKWTYLFEGKEKRDWDRFGFSKTELAKLPEPIKAFMASAKKVHLSGSSDQFGSLVTGSFEPLPEEQQEIISRFAVAFNQAYIRFLDLQKAETQAREAQVEAALERVRSRTIAMHKSEDLSETSVVLFNELKKLGIQTTRSGFGIYDEANQAIQLWLTTVSGQLSDQNVLGTIPLHAHYAIRENYTAWKENKPMMVHTFSGKEVKEYYQKIGNYLSISPQRKYPDRLVFSVFFFSEGSLNVMTEEPLTEDDYKIMLRFANVFGLTYRRFLDLQKAEAQAREAQIEASLEKVRSRSLAMQKPGELTEVAELLRKEMGQLGVEELETSSIYLVDKEKKQAECWYAIKHIREENKQLVSDEMTITFADTWVGTEMEKFYRAKKEHASIVIKGDNRKEWINYCAGKSTVLQGYYGDEIPERTYHLVKFNGGYMGAASPGDISEESWDLLRRAVSVFSLAYTRFSDLQIAEANARQAEQDLIAIKEAKQKAEAALTELQATQKQLIQSEKMASLGELTAGIAHEIQNPLNFVNNFSEVSGELLKELVDEVEKGNTDEVKFIAGDLIGNLEKINHHGKRAADIVKGMLQHSRSSSGVKEPTDINALCDEYLRLAYHGLRAKDKTFNATMKTDFDESIGNINIIPQDIGRVILNLITNAFYVVNEKSKQNITGYEPTVEVSTKKEGNKVLIAVKDNGNGIPQKVLDKIFQPFFTTKPTGQGTGLGLSLSYDIVKAHGGELKVETKEGGGSIFIIQIPTN
jgi:signal transduction histidine kinase/ketosteroid isomerase-like protein